MLLSNGWLSSMIPVRVLYDTSATAQADIALCVNSLNVIYAAPTRGIYLRWRWGRWCVNDVIGGHDTYAGRTNSIHHAIYLAKKQGG
jgi:hypothetical protein